MTTTAQITANRANAQSSTGPITSAGKALVSQNSLSHGLSSSRFAILPQEDPSEYHNLLEALRDEYDPCSPTESFLVEELARAQWKLRRIQLLETEILSGAGQQSSWSDLARRFAEDCSSDQVLLKLNRYEQAARRAWHQALTKLMTRRAQSEVTRLRQTRIHAREMEAAVHEAMAAPIPFLQPAPESVNYEAKPMPKHLERELLAHKHRDPLFDPDFDRSQMSKELRKYYESQF